LTKAFEPEVHTAWYGFERLRSESTSLMLEALHWLTALDPTALDLGALAPAQLETAAATAATAATVSIRRLPRVAVTLVPIIVLTLHLQCGLELRVETNER